jgi:hypothetical protein
MMSERTAVGSAGFWIFDDSLAVLETPSASIEVTRPQEIEIYARMFGHLKSTAIYGRPARALINNTITELGGRNLSQHLTIFKGGGYRSGDGCSGRADV